MRLPAIAGVTWFNQALKPQDLKGKVVLVDFWTYSCVNCQRTLPYLRKWWKDYKDKGFLIIGIHTPEFEFEKDPKNVEQATEDLGVSWPVVMDNDYINWNNFANHFWPAKYLADKDGNIVYTHFGEGAYKETEQKIRELVGLAPEPKVVSSLRSVPIFAPQKVNLEEHEHGAVCFIPTPETYCGYDRGRLSNASGYKENETFNYQPPEEIPENSIALSGRFLAKEEYIESAEPGATLLLNFRATEVNLVLGSADGQTEVEVSLDGKLLKTIEIKEPTMYNLLKSNDLTEGVLSVKARQGNFRAYAFTFSGCETAAKS